MAEEGTSGRPAPVRLDPIATLPIFFKLRGRRVVLAGGAAPAAWKAELLAAAGAALVVFAEEPSPAMVQIAHAPPDGSITLERRRWSATDLEGAALALGDCEDEEEAAAFRAAAQAVGVPVNVIDKPAFCDFQFGTLVSRSPLLVGISTDGAAPVLGQALRTRLEALLPPGLQAWADAARQWRPALQVRSPGFRERRRFWEAFADRAFAAADRLPREADRLACMAAAFDAPADRGLIVTLVGAGRGNPDGITLAAVNGLQNADAIAYAADLHPALVGYGRREAFRQPIPPDCPAAEAVDLLLAESAHGRIAWLDTGDPTTCLRWTDRASRLAALGVHVDRIEGLGRCSACHPHCPAWGADAPAGQVSSFTG